MLPLDLPHFPADLALQLVLAQQHLRFMGQQLVDLPQAGNGPGLLKNHLFVLVPQHDVLGDEIRQMARVPVVQDGGGDLLPQPGSKGCVLGEVAVGLPQQGLQLKLGDAGPGFPHRLHVALEVRLGLPQPAQPRPVLALHDDPHRAVSDAENLSDQGHGAHLVEVLRTGLSRAGLPLGHQKDVLVPLHGPLQCADGDVPLHVKAEDAAREDGQSPQGQHRHIQVFHNIHRSGLLSPAGRPGREKGGSDPPPCCYFDTVTPTPCSAQHMPPVRADNARPCISVIMGPLQDR